MSSDTFNPKLSKEEQDLVDLYVCEKCGHFVSMHGDNDVCYSCSSKGDACSPKQSDTDIDFGVKQTPEIPLKELDSGAIVNVYGPGVYEMEFVDKQGKTIGIYTVKIPVLQITPEITENIWKEFDNFWMHHLQDNLGLNESHPCLSFDVFAKNFISQHFILKSTAVSKKEAIKKLEAEKYIPICNNSSTNHIHTDKEVFPQFWSNAHDLKNQSIDKAIQIIQEL